MNVSSFLLKRTKLLGPGSVRSRHFLLNVIRDVDTFTSPVGAPRG
jgi:hypothetical protein